MFTNQQNIQGKYGVLVGGIEVHPFHNTSDAVSSIINLDGQLTSGFGIAINPEKVMAAIKDPKVRGFLQSATFRFPDGIGVVWAMRKKGYKTVRIPGCELWEALMKRAGEMEVPVYLIGAKPELVNKVVGKLSDDYNVNVVGYHHGYFNSVDESGIIDDIVASGAKIVTVAMGSPKQEKFIVSCRKKYSGAFYLGVGGTYDVYIGTVIRAPAWARKANMEWLYRLVQNPKRFRRQTILLKFLILLLLGKI